MIYDFVSGADGLDLSGIDVRVTLSGDQAFGFSDCTATAYPVWFAASKSEVVVRSDVSGDKTGDFEIRLLGLKSLTADDFVL